MPPAPSAVASVTPDDRRTARRHGDTGSDGQAARRGGTQRASDGEDVRERLLAGIPAEERRLQLAGVSTAVLEGGDGPPVVLLHGPGANAAHWMRVIPDLVTTHRVVAPDLPGQGASEVAGGPLDAERVLAWLGELIERTCSSPPALVGNALGGAIAARFAAEHGDRLGRLVLVDALGLTPFEPAPEFGAALQRVPRATDRAHPRRALAVLRARSGRLARADGRALGAVSRPTTSTVPARRACRPRSAA